MTNMIEQMYGIPAEDTATPPPAPENPFKEMADELPGPIEVQPGTTFDPSVAATEEPATVFGMTVPSPKAYSSTETIESGRLTPLGYAAEFLGMDDPDFFGAKEMVPASIEAYIDARNLRMSEAAESYQVGFNAEGTEVSDLINSKSSQSKIYLADTDEQFKNLMEAEFGEGNVRIIQDDGPLVSMFAPRRYVSVRRDDGTFTDFEPTTVGFSDYAERVAPGLLAEVGASSAVVGTALTAGATAGMLPGGIILGPAAFLYTLYSGGKAVEMGRQYLQDTFELNEEEAVKVSDFFDFLAQTVPGRGAEGGPFTDKTEAEVNREVAGGLELLFAAVPGFADRVKIAIGRARSQGKLTPGVFESAKRAQATVERTAGGDLDIGVPLQNLMLQQTTPNRIIGRLGALTEQTSIIIPQKVNAQMQAAIQYLTKYGDDVGAGNFETYQQAVANLSQTLRTVVERPESVKELADIGEDLGSLEDLFKRLRALEVRGMYNNVFDKLGNASYDLGDLRATMPGKRTILPTTPDKKVEGVLPTAQRGEMMIDNLMNDLLSIGREQKDGSLIITPAQVRAAAKDFAEKNPDYTIDVATIDSPAKLLQVYASRLGQLATQQYGQFGASYNPQLLGQAMRMRNDILDLIGNPREELADIATIRTDLKAANEFYRETDELTKQRLQVSAREARKGQVTDEPEVFAEAISTSPDGSGRVAPATRTLQNIQKQETYVREFLSNPENVDRLSGRTLELAEGPAKNALFELRQNFADVLAHKLSRALPTDPADVTQPGDVTKFLNSFGATQLRILGIDDAMQAQIRNDASLVATLQQGGLYEKTLMMPKDAKMADVFESIFSSKSDDIAIALNRLNAPVRRAGIGTDEAKRLTNELRGGLLNYIFSVDKGIFKQIDKPSAYGDVGQLTIDVPKFQKIVQQLKHSGLFKENSILTEQDEKMLDALVEYSAVINTRGADAGSALAGAQIIGEMFTIDPHKFISGLARLGSQARIAQLFANDQFVKAVTGTGKPMSTAEKLRTMFLGKGAFGSIIADVAMEQMKVRESDAEQTDRMLQDSGGDAIGSIYGNL